MRARRRAAFALALPLAAVACTSGQEAGEEAIGFYQHHLGDQWAFHCKFNPSCSNYGKQAVERYGLGAGTLMIADRLMRDHDYCYDLYAQDEDQRPLDPPADNALFGPRVPEDDGGAGAPETAAGHRADQEALANPPLDDDEQLAFADQLFLAHEWDRARIEYARLLFHREKTPHATRCHQRAAVCLARLGRRNDALAEAVAKSAPDGHTILFTSTQFAYAPSTFAKLPYDPLNDLVPVTLVSVSPQMIIAHPSLPANNPKQLVAFARSHPGEVSIGNAGNPLPTYSFISLAKAKMTPVPYKGAGPLQIDIMGGHVPLGMAAISSFMGTVKTGRVKVIGVCSLERTPLYPDAPPMAEGAPGFEAVAWFGMFVPRGTPPAVVKRIRDDVAEVLKIPDVRKRLHEIGGDPSGMPTEEFAKMVRSEIEKWNKVAKAAGVKPQ